MADILEYQASDAKAKWAELLNEVERGRTVRITRHGKTIARVVPETEVRAAEVAEAISEVAKRLSGRNSSKRRWLKSSRAAMRGTNIELRSRRVDLSAAWFLNRKFDPRVEAAFDTVTRVETRAPILLYYELRNALLVSERRNRITEAMSAAFLRDLALLPIRFELPAEDASLMTLARKRKLTVYDAAYLELAKREALPLATLDRALEKAAVAEGVALFGA